MSFINNLIGTILGSSLTWLGKGRLPQTDGVLSLPGLKASVEVFRDRWGIPHIYATQLSDLFFAQGFVHAQDRLFQMELNRRTALGRLSELFGPIALDTDRASRTFGFNRLGETDWKNASSEMREVILAYTQGVNAYLTHPAVKMPVEFTLLNHRPEPWQPEDSTSFARVMMWQLSHAWYGEIVRAQIVAAVGPERAAEIEISYPSHNPLSLPRGIEFNRLSLDGALVKAKGPFLARSMGSNSWAVSGRKTANGKAYLCNDMHLVLGLPSTWYMLHLESGDFRVTGVSLAGAPGVLVGHNDRIAWGMALAFTDCEDLFVEQFDPQQPQQYRFKDEWRKAEVVDEVIQLKGKTEPHVEHVTITHHGPIISDVVGYPEQRVAVNSMSLQPSPSLTGWLALNRAKNWDEFVAAMRLIEAPQLNVCYADVEGNIGYWVTGKVPVRAKGDGKLPAPGWTGEYEWVGEVPFEEMPHALNPEQGYVVTCNNRNVPDDYPYFLGDIWMNGYRARRIDDVLKGKDKVTVDDFRLLHRDFTCLPGSELVARLQGLESADPEVRLALERLKAWNGVLSTDSVGGSIYEVVRYHLVRNLFEPSLGKELTLRLMGQGFNPVLLASHEFYGHDTVILLRMLGRPDSWWMQQAGGFEALVTHSLKEAITWLRKELGNDPERWQWGRLHRAVFPHPLGLQKPLDLVFNRGPVPIGGDTDTPCQTAVSPHDPYNNNSWSPSFRQIVNMGDLSQSLVTSPPGQSGQLGSPHYDDLIDPWLSGEYCAMLWEREEVESQAKTKLVLSP